MKTYFSTTIYLLLLFSFGNSLSQTTITNKDYEVTDDVVKIEEYQSKTDSLSTYFSVLRNSNIYNNELYAEKHLSFSYGMLEEKKILDYTLFKDGNPKTYYYIHDVLNNQFIIEELGYDASKKEAKRYPIGRYILYGTPPLQFEFDTNKFQKINKSNNLVVVDDESIELINSNQIKHTYPGIYTKENYKVYNNKGQLIEYNGEYQHSKYYYYEDGLLSEDIDSDGTNATSITRYYYEKDKHDNWVKRIEVRSFQNEKDSETFSVSARKLTYKNGDITGSTDFDETFVKWELMQYVIDFKKEDNVATTEASKSKGCISGDCQNGNGTFVWEDNRKYIGTFKNGKLEGKGTYTFSDGAVYIGEFKKNTMNGYGKEYNKKNQLLYEGNYINYKYNGEGTVYLVNGDVYKGQFKDGFRTGFGTYTWAKSKNKYEGNWFNDQQNGKGTFYDYGTNIKQQAIYKEGKIVEVLSRTTISEPNNKNVSTTSKKTGCISGDCQNGFGTFVGIEGKDTIKIIGNFKNAVFSGYGKSYLNNQLTYDGQWEDFKYHGKGTLYTGDSNEHKFIGEFKNGIKEGPCKMYTNEKLVFEGNYVNNAIEGEGTYYNYKIGKKNVSIYKNGNPIKVISSEPIIVNNQKTRSNSVNTTNKITWKKNEANSYWLYDNGVLKNDGKSFWQGNNLYVYMVDEASLYLLKNYKTETPNITHKAELLPNTFPNGLWYKTSKGGVMAYNANGLFIKTTEIYKYDTNGIDVILKGKDEKETLFLKNFKNVSVNVVFPAEVYNASKASTFSSGNLKDESNIDSYILNCKSKENEATCLAQKLEEDVNKLQSQGKSQTEINNFLENKTKMLANYNVDTLYSTIMAFKYNSNTVKLLMTLTKKLPQHQQNRIKELANKTMSDYSKKQQKKQNKQRQN